METRAPVATLIDQLLELFNKQPSRCDDAALARLREARLRA